MMKKCLSAITVVASIVLLLSGCSNSNEVNNNTNEINLITSSENNTNQSENIINQDDSAAQLDNLADATFKYFKPINKDYIETRTPSGEYCVLDKSLNKVISSQEYFNYFGHDIYSVGDGSTTYYYSTTNNTDVTQSVQNDNYEQIYLRDDNDATYIVSTKLNSKFDGNENVISVRNFNFDLISEWSFLSSDKPELTLLEGGNIGISIDDKSYVANFISNSLFELKEQYNEIIATKDKILYTCDNAQNLRSCVCLDYSGNELWTIDTLSHDINLRGVSGNLLEFAHNYYNICAYVDLNGNVVFDLNEWCKKTGYNISSMRYWEIEKNEMPSILVLNDDILAMQLWNDNGKFIAISDSKGNLFFEPVSGKLLFPNSTISSNGYALAYDEVKESYFLINSEGKIINLPNDYNGILSDGNYGNYHVKCASDNNLLISDGKILYLNNQNKISSMSLE